MKLSSMLGQFDGRHELQAAEEYRRKITTKRIVKELTKIKSK